MYEVTRSYFITCMWIYFVLTRTVETRHKTRQKLVLFLSPYALKLTLSLRMSQEGLTGKGTTVPFSPFLLCHHS